MSPDPPTAALALPPSDSATSISSHETKRSSAASHSQSHTSHTLSHSHSAVLPAPPRETDAVNPQYKMNINDVLSSSPSPGIHPSIQTHDIERLVLRYNTAIRNFLKRYTSAAVSYRSIHSSSKGSKRDPVTHTRPPSWTALDHLFFNRRAIHDKFHTLQMQQVWQFARECDLIGPLLTSYDVSVCVKAMHAEHR